MAVKVKFVLGRRGGPVAFVDGPTFSGTPAFPDRQQWRGVLPQVGEEWEVEICGRSGDGHVSFLKPIRKVSDILSRRDRHGALVSGDWPRDHIIPALKEFGWEVIPTGGEVTSYTAIVARRGEAWLEIQPAAASLSGMDFGGRVSLVDERILASETSWVLTRMTARWWKGEGTPPCFTGEGDEDVFEPRKWIKDILKEMEGAIPEMRLKE